MTAVSNFWFGWLSEHSSPVSHHLVTTDVDEMDLPSTIDRELIRGRSMLVCANVIPFECVAGGSRDQPGGVSTVWYGLRYFASA